MLDAVRTGVSVLDRIESLVTNPELYALADSVPDPDPTTGGRPRHYPTYMWVLYDALVPVYGSGRKVQAELAHPIVWNHLRQLIAEQFPDDPARHLPKAPMRHFHYRSAEEFIQCPPYRGGVAFARAADEDPRVVRGERVLL